MKMNVLTRLVILPNLPTQGSVLEMIAKRNVRKKIDFTSDEIEKIELKESERGLSWRPDAKDLEVEFTDSEKDFLKSVIDSLDEKKLIVDAMLDFIEEIRA